MTLGRAIIIAIAIAVALMGEPLAAAMMAIGYEVGYAIAQPRAEPEIAPECYADYPFLSPQTSAERDCATCSFQYDCHEASPYPRPRKVGKRSG